MGMGAQNGSWDPNIGGWDPKMGTVTPIMENGTPKWGPQSGGDRNNGLGPQEWGMGPQ